MRGEPATKIDDFQPGQIIRHRDSGNSLIVTANYGDHAVAVRTQHIANPSEWLLIGKVSHEG